LSNCLPYIEKDRPTILFSRRRRILSGSKHPVVPFGSNQKQAIF